MALEQLIYASFGGILPALLWLHFWLREDKKHPEPERLIARTFLLGMLAVILVLPFQKGVEWLIPDMALPAIILWAVFEELFKFGAGYFGGLRSRYDNEPIDPIIYMVTAALGFVALENTLFVLGPLLGEDLPQAIVTANLRFVGASLLHIVSSGIVGAGLAMSFYMPEETRRKRLRKSLAAAISFHALFNILILNFGNTGTTLAFLSVWIGAVCLLWIFEKSKSIAPPRY